MGLCSFFETVSSQPLTSLPAEAACTFFALPACCCSVLRKEPPPAFFFLAILAFAGLAPGLAAAGGGAAPPWPNRAIFSWSRLGCCSFSRSSLA